MAIQIREIHYGVYGKCVEISNGEAEVVVTVDKGPRIIRYGLPGKVNMMCEAPDGTPEKTGWMNYGGHRLWHSPEAMPRTYEPDNVPVIWEPIEQGIHIVQDKEPWTQMVKELEITMDEDGTQVYILHRITNRGAWAAEFAIWALSVMAPGGKEIIPMTQRDTGFLGNRVLGLWPYTRMNDHRVWWGEKYIAIQQDPACKPPFKVGINNEYGWAAYFNHGQVFIKHHIHDLDEIYPDGGMSYETYTTNYMIEMETLSPLTVVEPGDSLEHEEVWELIDGVEVPENSDESIDAMMLSLLGDCSCDCCGCEDACDCGCEDGCDCGCDDECDCDCEDECHCEDTCDCDHH